MNMEFAVLQKFNAPRLFKTFLKRSFVLWWCSVKHNGINSLPGSYLDIGSGFHWTLKCPYTQHIEHILKYFGAPIIITEHYFKKIGYNGVSGPKHLNGSVYIYKCARLCVRACEERKIEVCCDCVTVFILRSEFIPVTLAFAFSFRVYFDGGWKPFFLFSPHSQGLVWPACVWLLPPGAV